MPQPAILLSIPAVVKARTDDGRRVIEVESSVETVDAEGDIILQSALLGAAKGFCDGGHVDIDHLSEIGGRLGIPNPASYIIGRPLEVKDIGGGRTSVVAQISKSSDGTVDPKASKADEFWLSLRNDPPAPWRASIYGFPAADGIVDTRVTKSAEHPDAKRFVVSRFERWQSLAMTMRPVCDAIKGTARIVTAKAFADAVRGQMGADAGMTPGGAAAEARKAMSAGAQAAFASGPEIPYFLPPQDRIGLLGHYFGCMEKGLSPFAGGPGRRSVLNFREHFQFCCRLPEYEADVMALALMQLLKRERQTA